MQERQIELLEQSQRKAVATALAKGGRFAKRLPLVINGERKAHDVIVSARRQSTAAIAVDVAALEKAKARSTARSRPTTARSTGSAPAPPCSTATSG